MPGLGRGPLGRGGMPPGVGPGRGACGRGAGAPEPTPNGLLPTLGPGRGVCGRGACGRGGCGRGVGTTGPGAADGGAGLAGAGVEAGLRSGAAGAGAAASTAGAGTGAGAGAGAGAAFFAGAFLPAPALFGCAGGKASRSLRATGASTVDDALFTNSPRSLSFARTSLLVTPSSLASSCTRALPATGLLRRTGRASRSIPARRGWYSSLALHRVPIALLLPAEGAYLCCAADCSATYSRTGAGSSAPTTRRARANARRRSASATHRGSRCSQAPRPGARRRGSGTTSTHSGLPVSVPDGAGATTTRSNSAAADRFRHPMHVRTGACASRRAASDAVVDRTTTTESTTPRVRACRAVQPPGRTPSRCGCRCASR
jgi:hypothetical protein